MQVYVDVSLMLWAHECEVRFSGIRNQLDFPKSEYDLFSEQVVLKIGSSTYYFGRRRSTGVLETHVTKAHETVRCFVHASAQIVSQTVMHAVGPDFPGKGPFFSFMMRLLQPHTRLDHGSVVDAVLLALDGTRPDSAGAEGGISKIDLVPRPLRTLYNDSLRKLRGCVESVHSQIVDVNL